MLLHGFRLLRECRLVDYGNLLIPITKTW